MRVHIYFIAIALGLCSSLANPGLTHYRSSPEEVEIAELLGKSFGLNLDVSIEQNQKYKAVLEARFNCSTGRFQDVKLFLPSGNSQIDLELLDAVLSMDKVSVPDNLKGNGFMDFEFRIGASAGGEINEIAKRYRRDFEPNAKCFAFHAIPLSVLQKYPTLFTYLELTAPAHFRSVAINKIKASEIAKLREPWLRFFDSHPSASKQQVLELEKELDIKFGLLRHLSRVKACD